MMSLLPRSIGRSAQGHKLHLLMGKHCLSAEGVCTGGRIWNVVNRHFVYCSTRILRVYIHTHTVDSHYLPQLCPITLL